MCLNFYDLSSGLFDSVLESVSLCPSDRNWFRLKLRKNYDCNSSDEKNAFTIKNRISLVIFLSWRVSSLIISIVNKQVHFHCHLIGWKNVVTKILRSRWIYFDQLPTSNLWHLCELLISPGKLFVVVGHRFLLKCQ